MTVEVGQIVYLNPGINRRRRRERNIVEGVVKTVGRKYYTVVIGSHEYQFEKKGLKQKTDCTPDYYLYFDRQDVLDEHEKSSLLLEVRIKIRDIIERKISLHQLRRIKAILDEENET